CMQGTQFWTF
nr:immunoglobulin light chain junction region [Macaca mulatta]MOW08608.1 immunoglobulin light chain junction region [Macaca mulatta]MOW08901.1 immunoglobulin light chain junction region [Macaca mulatta]MOW09326.1 immunoglobulin light chain junction region [Macaca mulatta]MOW09852.1 immunoglobulin light chain junction region [Macaca mulatta]